MYGLDQKTGKILTTLQRMNKKEVEILDKLFSNCIKKKFNGIDIYTKRPKKIEGHVTHHPIHKNRSLGVRWDLRNGIWLSIFGHSHIHENVNENNNFIEWWKRYIGEKEYNEIIIMSHSASKIDFDQKYEELNEYLL